MSHFNYTLFPLEEKTKAAIGIKKNEVFDFIISKQKEANKRNSQLYSNYLYGCHCQSYELYSNDFNITLNNDCNKLLKQEIYDLLKEIENKRKKLDNVLKSYPYGTLIQQSCARSSRLLTYFGDKFGYIATLMFFVWIWWFLLVFEFIFCYPFYCIYEPYRIKPTISEMEQWFDTKICCNIEDFDAFNLDNYVIERLQEIYNKIKIKFNLSLKSFTYLDEVEVASPP